MSYYAKPQFDELMATLTALEAKLIKGYPPKPRVFLRFNGGLWWIPGDFRQIPKMILGQNLIGYRKQQLLRVIQYHLGQRRESRQINTRAEFLLVKKKGKKISAFYPDSILRIVCKEKDLGTSCLSRSVEGMEAMRASYGGEIHIPKVRAAGEEKGFYYLWEERVDCRTLERDNPEDQQKITQELVPLLMDWYEPIRWDSMTCILGEEPETLVEKALTSPNLAQMEPETVQMFHKVAAQIDDYNFEVPVAMAHGDIHHRNICVTPKGKLVLVDWETWGQHLVLKEFIDLARVFGFGSGVHQKIRQAYNQRFADSSSGFDEQLLVYYFLHCSKRLVQISQKQESQSHQHHPTRKTSDISQSEKYVLERLKNCRELLDEINQHQDGVARQTYQLPLSQL